MVYLGRHSDFSAVVDGMDLDCVVPGSDLGFFYYSFTVLPFTILAISLYTLSVCCKLQAALSFLLCPEWILRCKKRQQGIPLDFDHLYDELHSDSDDDVHKKVD